MKIEQGEGIHNCDQKNCTETRRVNVRNSSQFFCPHIDKVLTAVKDGLVVTV